MPLYDRVLDGQIVDTRDLSEAPGELAPNKGVWLEQVMANPDFEADPFEDAELTISIESNRVLYTWVGTAWPLERVKAAKMAEIEAAYAQKATTPFAWNFGSIEGKDDDENSTGPAGAQTLQMRFDPANGVDDPKNWIAVTSTLALIVAVAPSTIVPMKTTGNIWAQVTAAEAAQVLVAGDGSQEAMFPRQVRYLARYGALKKALAAAADSAAVLAIDPATGWSLP